MSSAADFWDRLKTDQIVEGERPDPGSTAPWYVRAMLGFAGWIGALFLLAFVAAGFAAVMESELSATALGALCCGGAYAMFRGLDGNDFAEQFGLAVSLAGQGLIITGLWNLFPPSEPTFYVAVCAVQAALAVVVPNFLHRVITAAGAAVAAALAIDQLSLNWFVIPLLCAALAFIWLDPERWATGGRVWRPAGYGLVLALLLIETFRLFNTAEFLGIANEAPRWLQEYGPLIGRGLTAAVLLWVAFALVRSEGLAPASRPGLAAIGGALAIAGVSLLAPGLASALIVLLLGFAAGNRVLTALGILGLLGFVTHFYYSLHATLLEKSGTLAVAGVCLLGAYFFLRAPAAAPEPDHA